MSCSWHGHGFQSRISATMRRRLQSVLRRMQWDPDRVAPNPSLQLLCPPPSPVPHLAPSPLCSILCNVVGGYSRLPDLYTATGTGRTGGRTRQREREREMAWVVVEETEGERLHCLIETSETLFVVGNHKNTILCVNTGPVCLPGTRTYPPPDLIRDARWSRMDK